MEKGGLASLSLPPKNSWRLQGEGVWKRQLVLASCHDIWTGKPLKEICPLRVRSTNIE